MSTFSGELQWYVGWYNPEGKRKCKSCGPGDRGKQNAQKLRRKVEAELMTGTYKEKITVLWEGFRKDYESRIMAGLGTRTRAEIKAALDHFERLVKPAHVAYLTTSSIDQFIAARRKEPGKKRGDLTSPATINKDLRHLRAVLTVAQEWGHLQMVPKFRMEKVPQKLPGYVTGTHFTAVYLKCDLARFPADLPYPAADWWRALLVTGYMTGWRISELLALRRADLDLDAGTALTRAEDNKGKRDGLVSLPAEVVEHLRRLVSFDPFVFPFPHFKTTLYKQFAEIQEAAAIHLPCDKEHHHTRYCHVYGFHDLRRAFATMNADSLTPDALRDLMRHKSYSTTQLYINTARQLNAAAAKIHVPEVLQSQKKGSDGSAAICGRT